MIMYTHTAYRVMQNEFLPIKIHKYHWLNLGVTKDYEFNLSFIARYGIVFPCGLPWQGAS